jgi:putative FmdB family regulatory protein
MPIYEYKCDACGKQFEQIQKFSDPPLDVCPQCGKGPVQRLLSAPAFQFKGSGWYVTDYAKKGSSDAGEKTGKSDKADKSETTPAAEKSDSKPAVSETKSSTPSTPSKD